MDILTLPLTIIIPLIIIYIFIKNIIQHFKCRGRLRNNLKILQFETNIKLDKVWFSRDNGFSTTNFFNKIMIIFYNKQLDKYEDLEISYVLGHEIAHHEFKTIGSSKNTFLNKENRRICKIINELFCDIRGRQISGLSDNEIVKYFINNDVRYPIASNRKESWKGGYFISEVRAKLVNKYYNDFIDDKLDIKLFAEDIMDEHNKVCLEGHEISNIDIIIDGINNNLKHIKECRNLR